VLELVLLILLTLFEGPFVTNLLPVDLNLGTPPANRPPNCIGPLEVGFTPPLLLPLLLLPAVPEEDLPENSKINLIFSNQCF
jgi:hypothetical protein